jgi:hypothetical protein
MGQSWQRLSKGITRDGLTALILALRGRALFAAGLERRNIRTMTFSKDTFDRLAFERAREPQAPADVVDVKRAESEASPDEKRAQEAYAQQVEAQADAIPDPEMSNAHRAKAARIRNSLPVMEYLDRRKKLREAQADTPSGYEGIDMRAGYAAAVNELEQANAYNPLLLEILTSGSGLKPEAFLGIDSTEADIAAVDAANVILGVEKARTVKPLSDREYIDRAVAKAMAPRMTELHLMRRQLEDFKADQERQGVRFG